MDNRCKLAAVISCHEEAKLVPCEVPRASMSSHVVLTVGILTGRMGTNYVNIYEMIYYVQTLCCCRRIKKFYEYELHIMYQKANGR